MSDTPETDAAYNAVVISTEAGDSLPKATAMLKLARKLERERDELAALLAAEKSTRNSIIEKGVKTERERDEARKHLRDANRGAEINAHINQKFAQRIIDAREQIKELIYIAERAIALAEIDFENDKFGVVSELRDGVQRIKEGAK